MDQLGIIQTQPILAVVWADLGNKTEEECYTAGSKEKMTPYAEEDLKQKTPLNKSQSKLNVEKRLQKTVLDQKQKAKTGEKQKQRMSISSHTVQSKQIVYFNSTIGDYLCPWYFLPGKL